MKIFRTGALIFKQGAARKAIATLTSAIQLNAGTSVRHTYFRQGKFEAAVADYAAAIQRDAAVLFWHMSFAVPACSNQQSLEEALGRPAGSEQACSGKRWCSLQPWRDP